VAGEGGEGASPGSGGKVASGGKSGSGTGGKAAGGTGSTGTGGSGGTVDPNTGGDAGHGGEGGVPGDSGDECSDSDLCDLAHAGVDDDCDGLVDEGCPCVPGLAQACFLGDASKRNAPGCFDGHQECTDRGTWGYCVGGVHDLGDGCGTPETDDCHAITALPFASVALEEGTGTFSLDAVPGSESFSVTCPPGLGTCPAPMGSNLKPIQSGEYTVTYSKLVAGDSNPHTCTYPLIVGANGLRVELTWEHTTADSGVDLDLHLHQPNSTHGWGFGTPIPADCAFANCTIGAFGFPDPQTAPDWFVDPNAAPPDPVGWYLDPVVENNTCYNAPRGYQWSNLGKGCHNPRLDIDTIICNAALTDPTDPEFCFPENINVDFPPSDQWMRIGVNYYSNASRTYDVHPEVKVYCGGVLAARLGSQGYYSPEAPVTFVPADGNMPPHSGTKFWAVADVAFTKEGGNSRCTVRPIYENAEQRTPYFMTAGEALSAFGPASPALP
jgi:hypothetical protein